MYIYWRSSVKTSDQRACHVIHIHTFTKLVSKSKSSTKLSPRSKNVKTNDRKPKNIQVQQCMSTI